MKLLIVGKPFKGHELKQLLLLNLFGDLDYCWVVSVFARIITASVVVCEVGRSSA